MASVKSLGLHTSAGLDYLIAESILPPDPSPDLYEWETYQDQSNGFEEDELVTTTHCVVWSRGGVVQRVFRLVLEDDPIIQSLLTYFEFGEQHVDDQTTSSPLKSRALVILLKLKAHIYFLSGTSHIVSLPAEVEKAYATPRGLILQRKLTFSPKELHLSPSLRAPPNSLQVSRNQLWSSPISPPAVSKSGPSIISPSENSPFDLTNLLQLHQSINEDTTPRLLTLTDPLLEVGVIVEYSRRTGLGYDLIPLDQQEELLHIETCAQNSQPTAKAKNTALYVLTANRKENRYSIWRASYVEPTSLTQWTSEAEQTDNALSPLLRKSFGDRSVNNGNTPGARNSVGKRDSFIREHASQPSFEGSRSNLGRRSDLFKNDTIPRSNDPLAIGSDFHSPNKNSAANRRASSMVARAELPIYEANQYKDWSRQSTGPMSSQPQRGRRYPSSNFGRDRKSFEATLMPTTPSDGTHEQDRRRQDLSFSGGDEAMKLDPKSGSNTSAFPSDLPGQHPLDTMKAELVMEKLITLPFKIPDLQVQDYDQGNVLPTPSMSMRVFFFQSTDNQSITYLIHNLTTSTLSEVTIRLPENYPLINTGESWDSFFLHHITGVIGAVKILDGDEAAFIITQEADNSDLTEEPNKSDFKVTLFPPFQKLPQPTLPRQTLLLTADSKAIRISLPRPNMTTLFDHLSEVDAPRSLPQRGIVRNKAVSPSSTAKGHLAYPGCLGQFDIVDSEGSFVRFQTHLRPRNMYVGKILNICNNFLSEKGPGHQSLLCTWWNICRTRNVETHEGEWESLVIALFSTILWQASPELMFEETHGEENHLTSSQENIRGSLFGQGWNWLSLSQSLDKKYSRDGFLLRCCAAAKTYLQTKLFLEADERRDNSLKSGQSKADHDTWSKLILALHLLREEEKLNTNSAEANPGLGITLAPVLAQFGHWFGWTSWSGHHGSFYSLEDDIMDGIFYDQSDFNGFKALVPMDEPPSIFAWLSQAITFNDIQSFPILSKMIDDGDSDQSNAHDGLASYLVPRTEALVSLFKQISAGSTSLKSVIEIMVENQIDADLLETFPEGIVTPLRSLISRFRCSTPSQWTSRMSKFVEREDIYLLDERNLTNPSIEQTANAGSHIVSGLDVRGICEASSNSQTAPDSRGGTEIMKSIFRDDTRALEPAKLLCPQLIPVAIMHPTPGYSESQFLEAQQAHAKLVYVRTMSLVSGQALLEYQCHRPLPTQKLDIRLFNTSCRMQPSGITVNADRSNFVEEKVSWAFFHAGVQAGLRITEDAEDLDTSWLYLNKPNELGNRHAGLLLGLGLNGHLQSMAKWLAFKYLTPKHDMTSIGLLLGLSASRIGSLDSLITRVLSIHLVSLLPPGSAELNLSPLVQTAGTMGIGLLYYNSRHRRMSEKMLSELENVDFDSQHTSSSPFNRDEGYRLAAGFALGLINLGKGAELSSLRGLQVEERLVQLATGPFHIDFVHVLDQATAGATIALALIFMKTEMKSIANKIDIPHTIKRFDNVRPDIFLLRILARNLILWSEIVPSQEWMWSCLPKDLRSQLKPVRQNVPGLQPHILDSVALEPMSSRHLPLYNILAGLCWSIGLKYAGTANIIAREVLLSCYDKVTDFLEYSPQSYDERLTLDALMRFQHLLILSAATVMAGTGDLPLLQRARILHATVNEYSTFGYHQAAHMAMGALFLGQGRYSFGTSNLAIASLICAFYPIFPQEVLDNRAHLQAFRHFWVLAAEPRCLLPRDVETQEIITTPIEVIKLDNTTLTINAPSLLPDIRTISKVQTLNEQYWQVVLDFKNNPHHLASFQKHQTIFLKRKSLLSQYSDPFNASLTIRKGPQSMNGSALDAFKWIFNLPSFEPLGIGYVQAESMFPRGHQEDPRTRSIVHSRGTGPSKVPLYNGPLSAILDRRTTGIDDVLVLRGAVGSDNRTQLMNLRILLQWAEKEMRNGRRLEWNEWIGEEAFSTLRAEVIQRANVEAASNATDFNTNNTDGVDDEMTVD